MCVSVVDLHPGVANKMENTVELIGWYGGDETHCLSAWSSTKRELTEERKSRMDKMLKMLAEEEHGTPFEKSYLHFLVTCDTAAHIHLLKHRIGVSINAESARYKELKEDKYYFPVDWERTRVQEVVEHLQESYRLYHKLLEELTPDLGRKRAKESARFILPYANQLTLDVGFNFRSFMHFQKLRNSEHAQLEIREIARKMLVLVKETGAFNMSLEAFGY